MTDPPRPVHVCTCSICQTTPDTPNANYHRQINQLLSRLSEPQRRWYVGSLSLDPTGPSDAQLAVITGLSLPTIRRGRRELAAGLPDEAPARQRQPGGGRHRAEKKIPT
jgi:hypothetical protein